MRHQAQDSGFTNYDRIVFSICFAGLAISQISTVSLIDKLHERLSSRELTDSCVEGTASTSSSLPPMWDFEEHLRMPERKAL